MIYETTYHCPLLGEMTLASDGEKIMGLWLTDQKYFGGSVDDERVRKDDLPVFTVAKDWLDRYFSGEAPRIDELPLGPNGTAFRHRVWQILTEIPYGEVRTYGDIAQQIAAEQGKEKMSAQAVGGAVGHNPIAVIVPCHRVVGSDGSLTGFASGIGMKVKLLELEGVDMSDMFIPKKGTAL